MIKRYILEVEELDGDLCIRSKNDGFKPTELLGILYLKMNDITKQAEGDIKPENIKREVVSNN